jgi:hypothetical protein
VESFLEFYAPAVANADRDIVGHNYVFAFDRRTERWQMINYDHTGAYQTHQIGVILGTKSTFFPGSTSWNRLYDRLMDVPQIRAAHFRRLRQILEGPLEPSNLEDVIEGFADEIMFDALRDVRKRGREDPDGILDAAEDIFGFMEIHRDLLLDQLAEEQGEIDPEEFLVINEVMSDNDGTLTDERGDADPWLELFNAGTQTVSLRGLFLSDDVDNLDEWEFPRRTNIDPGEHLIVWLDGEPNEGSLHTSFRLSSNGATDLSLVAKDRKTTLSQITVTGLGENQSIGAYPDGALNMITMGSPTPGGPNIDPPLDFAVRINEVMAINSTTLRDEDNEFEPWVEIHNLTCTRAPLGGLHLTDDEDDPTKWEIPDGVTVPYLGHLVLWLDGEEDEGDRHASFTLAGAEGELLLYDRDGLTLLDRLVFPSPVADVSHGRFPDGADSAADLTVPTPGKRNAVFDAEGLRINEVLASNDDFGTDELGEHEDWIEIVNVTDEPIDLAGYHLTDDPERPTRWQFPSHPDAVVPPGERILVWADDDNDPPDGPLHTNFKLDVDGEEVWLFGPDGATLIDAMTYGELATDLAFTRIPDSVGGFVRSALPTPGQINTLAVSLQRLVNDVLGGEALTSNEAIEADRNEDDVIDAADIVRSVGLAHP